MAEDIRLNLHRGKFRISGVILDRALRQEKFARAMQAIFSKVIPVGVQFDYMRQELCVEAFSPEFEEVQEGCCVPEYVAIFNATNDVSFRKC